MCKKLTSLFLSIIMIMGMLSGCGKKQTTNQPAKNEKVTIRFMDIMPGPDRQKVYQEIITKFEEKNPSIKVEYESVPWDQAHNKLVTLGTSKSMPDVVQVYPAWLSEFKSANWIDDITSRYEKSSMKNSFTPFIQNFSIKQDQVDLYKGVYIIPDGLMVGGLFIRNDWFKEAGVKAPETWDDFFTLSEKLTDKSQNRYGVSYRGARAGFDQIMNYVLSVNKGQIYDKDGNCTLSKPESIEAFKRYTDIYKKGYAPKDSINWGYAEMVQGFTSGLTGMLNQTTEVVTTCQQNMKEGTWAVSSWPKGADGMIYGNAGFSTGYSIGSNSEYKEEAWKFIEFLSSPEINMIYCKGNTLLPIVKEASSDTYFGQGPMKGYVDMMSGSNYALAPALGYFPELNEFRESLMDAEVQKYLLGNQSAEATMNKLSDWLTTHQKKYMKDHPEIPVPGPRYIAKN